MGPRSIGEGKCEVEAGSEPPPTAAPSELAKDAPAYQTACLAFFRSGSAAERFEARVPGRLAWRSCSTHDATADSSAVR